GDAIAVAHPDVERRAGLERREEALAALDRDGRGAVLALARGLDLAAEEVTDELHAVADPEHGDAEREDAGVDVGRPVFEDARGPAGEHDGVRLERADAVEADRARLDLAVDVLLADAPRDELRVLRAEVEDEDEA